MNTPNVNPNIVVIANPLNKPAPANHNGIIAEVVVTYAVMIIKMPFFTLFFQSTN